MGLEKVAVAMSGGVDSSVASLLLTERGYDIVGISMHVWGYSDNGCSAKNLRRTCCAADDFRDARQVAGKLGFPYYVFDFQDIFKEKVIDVFVDSYEKGLTPNPCIDCNSKVKFSEFRKRAASVGCSKVATGHYARIVSNGDGYRLLRGVDSQKDQSYFLYELTQQDLSETIFPLGEMTKDEVREIARRAGLRIADKEESQDICFVSGTLSSFLRNRIGERPGDIVDKSGKKLGTHKGIYNYTVGQRRGLNIGGSDEPLYVLELDFELNRVIVGRRNELDKEDFLVNRLSFVSPTFKKQVESGQDVPVYAQLRHRSSAVRVNCRLEREGVIRVMFEDEFSLPSPGQAAVFYCLDNKEVLGGGRIFSE